MWCIQLLGKDLNTYAGGFSNTLGDVIRVTSKGAKQFTSEYAAYQWAKAYLPGYNYKILYGVE